MALFKKAGTTRDRKRGNSNYSDSLSGKSALDWENERSCPSERTTVHERIRHRCGIKKK